MTCALRSPSSARAPGQRALFNDELDRALGVVDHRLDLAAVTDDAGVVEQAGYVTLAEARHDGEIEAGEGAAKGIPLAQDGQPRKTGLEALEAQLLELRRSSANGNPHSESW